MPEKTETHFFPNKSHTSCLVIWCIFGAFFWTPKTRKTPSECIQKGFCQNNGGEDSRFARSLALPCTSRCVREQSAEAILKGLDPTDEGQRKKAAKNLLGKVNWKGTY